MNWSHAATSYNSKRKSLAEFEIGDSTPKRARQGSKESPWHKRGQQHYESRSNNNGTFGDPYKNDNGEPFSSYAGQLAHQSSVKSTYTINGEWDELQPLYELEMELRELCQQGHKIQAIKRYRSYMDKHYNIDITLKIAKYTIDALSEQKPVDLMTGVKD